MSRTAPPSSSSSPHSDVLIVGAGPAGLALAIALAQGGLAVTVLEQQPAGALAQPVPDGREIALTHPSRATLERLGIWAQLAPAEVGRIRAAHVHDGPVARRSPLRLGAEGTGEEALGFIVPNHALRRAAHAVAAHTPGLRIVAGTRVTGVAVHAQHAAVDCEPVLPPGSPLSARTQQRPNTPQRLHAPLLVAADSRFSATRRQLGIGARMVDFGRTVIVCRMRHARPHGGIAHECFGYERTLAVLPLPDAGSADDGGGGSSRQTGAGAAWAGGAADVRHRCSVVVTAGATDAVALLALPPEAFAAAVQAQFGHRLGAMQLDGDRHAYPLVASYAERLTGPRCALLGDAAVGMHPVTAHGFNLGLAGVERLTAAVLAAHRAGRDIGQADTLAAYADAHHRHAWPMYQGTNAIVRLYTDPRPVPRLVRQLVLQGARRLPPLQAAIVGQLTGKPPGWMRALAPWLPAVLSRT